MAGERDWEAEAAAMGHVPEDQWKGAKDKWLPAKEYVERGEKVLPIVQEHNTKLKKQLERAETALKDLQESQGDFAKYIAKEEAQKHAARITELEAQLAVAVTDGDGAAAVKAQKEIREAEESLRKAGEKAEAKNDKATEKNEQHPEYAAWLAKNRWYEDDEDLQIEANMAAAGIAKQKGLKAGPELWELVRERVAKANPDKFPKPRGNGKESHVEDDPKRGGDRQTRTNNGDGKKTYEDLPAAPKKELDRMINSGWFGKGLTKEQIAEKRQAYVDRYDFDSKPEEQY